MQRGGIQHRMPINREITVAPDRFEVAADDAILAEINRQAGSAIAPKLSWKYKVVDRAKGTDREAAAKVGTLVAQRALEKGLKDVVFDRGGYIFHGRIKALAKVVSTWIEQKEETKRTALEHAESGMQLTLEREGRRTVVTLKDLAEQGS